jgi:uncharacterized ubiquitin-like protein YukD
MDYILITLCAAGKNEDLKVPCFLPVGELIDILKELYGANASTLHASPKGIILDRNKTLEEQGVLHGAKLTLD